MARRWNALLRKAAPIFGAGLLLQANGCAVDLNAALEGLVTSITNSFLTNFIFTALNLPPPVF